MTNQPARKPPGPRKRTATGGQRIHVWLNSELQAALGAYAAQHGITVTVAARRILADWQRRSS